jgi:hypothetical protein
MHWKTHGLLSVKIVAIVVWSRHSMSFGLNRRKGEINIGRNLVSVVVAAFEV